VTPIVEGVSALLVDAHRRGVAVAAEPEGTGDLSREQAYAVQDAVALALGGADAWKTGAPSPEAEPIAAPILSPLIAASPATLAASRFLALGVEAEIAFRFARAMPPRGSPYSREDVIDAIAALVPAIEVVDSRLGPWAAASPGWKLADNQSNGFLVHGEDVRDWRALDLQRFPVELWIDGHCVVAGADSGNPAGDPLRLCTWLVNHLAATRDGLAAGAIVTTGSFTGLLHVDAGQRVVARYPGLGEVTVAFT